MRIVIPSVNYADFLSVTLPGWQVFAPLAKVVVVTSTTDSATRRVAKRHGVVCHATDVWYRDGVPFDKASALNEAFGFTGTRRPPKVGELCLSVDADVYPFGALPSGRLNKHRLYGCARFLCESLTALESHRADADLSALSLILPRSKGNDAPTELGASEELRRRSAHRCLGYFQLFRYRPGIMFEPRPTAGGYDISFRAQFEGRVGLTTCYVLHLGGLRRDNWRGRTVAAWEGR
jgi:hypothetical protein